MSVILLHCSNCNVDFPVCSEEPEIELMNVNLAFIAGIISLGLSLYQLNELCSTLRIPTVSRKNYRNYLDQLHLIYKNSFDENKDTTDNLDQAPIKSSTPILKTDDYETKKRNFLQSLQLTIEEIEKLYLITINQRDDPLWYQERRKRLTASNFGRIFKLLDSTDKTKVAKDILFSKFTGNIYTKYGSENEINAIKDFEKLLGKKVTPCGLFVHSSHAFLAASPDGLIGNDAIIEVKCPYKAKDFTPSNAIEQKLIQFAYFNDGMFKLKRNDKYYCQVQGQLFITGKEFCYFVVWSPRGLLYEKIEKDEQFWNEMFPKLKTFYFEYLLPLILKEI